MDAKILTLKWTAETNESKRQSNVGTVTRMIRITTMYQHAGIQ